MSKKEVKKTIVKRTIVKKEEPIVATPYWDAATDINEKLPLDVPLDVTMTEEQLNPELMSLLPSTKKGDDLSPATWNTLKSLGWKDEAPPIVPRPLKPGVEPKAPRTKGPGRSECIGRVLAQGTQFDNEVAAKADAMYVASGHKSNIATFQYYWDDEKTLLRGIGILEEKNGKVSIRK